MSISLLGEHDRRPTTGDESHGSRIFYLINASGHRCAFSQKRTNLTAPIFGEKTQFTDELKKTPEKTAADDADGGEHVLLSVELRYGDACLHNTKYRLVYSG